MAEFCLDCLNKYYSKEDEQLTEEDVTVCEDLCEECGEIKDCVITIKIKESKERKKHIGSDIKKFFGKNL